MLTLIPYTRKIFVSYVRESAWNHYLLMRAWRQENGSDFDFCDMIYGQVEAQNCEFYRQNVMRVMADCGVYLLLLDDLTRFCERIVRCELQVAIDLNKPIIVMNLNGRRAVDMLRMPDELSAQFSVHIGFAPQILQHALQNWPLYLTGLRPETDLSHYYFYSDAVYQGVGL